MAIVTIRVDANAIRGLTSVGGVVDQDMQRRALRVESQAKMRAPVDTGRMRAAGLSQRAGGYPAGSWAVVFPVNYSLYQDRGTRFMRGTQFLSGALPAAL